MKTPLRKKYIDRLASLNDQLCFFQFNRNELNKRLNEFGENAGALYTPDLFAQNVMAPRINVRINELPKFQELNQKYTFGAYFSTSYEVFSNYLIDSLELLKQFNSSTFVLTNDNQLEEKYTLTLASSGCTVPARELIDTIKYIRLRRNLITHIAESISTQLEGHILAQGLALNTYWRSAITYLDFQNPNVINFEEGETIDLLKLLRIIVETFDSNLASHLSINGMVTYIATEQFASNPQRLNSYVIKERVRKVKKLGETIFETSLNESDIEPIVKEIGKK
jgi:hypothetical protein